MPKSNPNDVDQWRQRARDERASSSSRKWGGALGVWAIFSTLRAYANVIATVLILGSITASMTAAALAIDHNLRHEASYWTQLHQQASELWAHEPSAGFDGQGAAAPWEDLGFPPQDPNPGSPPNAPTGNPSPDTRGAPSPTSPSGDARLPQANAQPWNHPSESLPPPALTTSSPGSLSHTCDDCLNLLDLMGSDAGLDVGNLVGSSPGASFQAAAFDLSALDAESLSSWLSNLDLLPNLDPDRSSAEEGSSPDPDARRAVRAAERSGRCPDALDKALVATLLAPENRSLLAAGWRCFNVEHQAPLLSDDDPSSPSMITSLLHLEGRSTPSNSDPSPSDTPWRWREPPEAGLEYRWMRLLTYPGDPTLVHHLQEVLGEDALVQDLGLDLLIELSVANRIRTQPDPSPALRDAWARRIYLTRLLLRSEIGALFQRAAPAPLRAAVLHQYAQATRPPLPPPVPRAIQAVRPTAPADATFGTPADPTRAQAPRAEPHTPQERGPSFAAPPRPPEGKRSGGLKVHFPSAAAEQPTAAKR